MANIQKSVTRAFQSSDTKINYNIVEKGSSSLLTGIYGEDSDVAAGFYRKPDITGNGEETKLALYYGEVMTTPYLVDAGVNSSTNDPSSILKTYRFITGDGTNEGIPVGPNGTPLENIYIPNANGQPTPVVDSNGRPSLQNVILASALGSAITSVPKIWDAIKGAAPATSQTKTVDPVTGKPLPSTTEKAATTIGKNLALGELTNVSETGKAQDYALVYDTTQQKWVPKSINELVGSAFSGTTICGGSGGSGGTGGSGSSGASSGGAGATRDPDPFYTTSLLTGGSPISVANQLNVTSLVMTAEDIAAARPTLTVGYINSVGDDETLGTISVGPSFTLVNIGSAISGLLTTYFGANSNPVVRTESATGVITAYLSPLQAIAPDVGGTGYYTGACPSFRFLSLWIKDSGGVKKTNSLDTEVCGTCYIKSPRLRVRDVIAASTANIPFDSITYPAYAATTSVVVTRDFNYLNGGNYWLSGYNITTAGSGYYVPFVCSLGNNPANAKVSGGAVTGLDFSSWTSTSYAVPTFGVATPISIVTAAGLAKPTSVRLLTKAAGISTIDGVTINNGDLFLLKDQTNKKENGVYKKVSSTTFEMIEELCIITYATNGLWTHVTGGTTNTNKDFLLNDATQVSGPVYFVQDAQTWVEVTDVTDPCAPGGAGGGGGPGAGSPGGSGSAGSCTTITTTPPPPPTITLASPCSRGYGVKTVPPAFDKVTLPTITTTSGIASPTVTVLYSITNGDGVFSLAAAIPGTVTSTIGTRTIQFVGPNADVMTASAQVRFQPADNSLTDISYTVVITNNDGTKNGVGCTIIPTQIVVENSQAATACIAVDPVTVGGTGKVKVTFNGKTLDLTNGFVSYITSPTVTAAVVASNINANVAIKNALDPTNAAWLPLFVATSSTNKVNIAAPAAGGSDFNGMTLSSEVTGGFLFAECGSTFLGGVTATINDFLKNNVPNWDKVSNVLIGIGGNVLGAVLTNVIMNNVSQVQISIPTNEDVTVSFLYRGRKVTVPNEYNAAARTGHPTYAGWSGVWKTQWTQNPAWCAYDYITNKKYGLGNIIQLSTAQQTALLQDIFEIGLYCDNIVTDIDGNPQPRFSLNTVITDGTRMQVLEQLCSVFYGTYFFKNGGLRIGYDHYTTQIDFLVNQANAGEFTKAFSSASNFINKVRLTYVEPSNFYTESIVVAEDTNSIETYGERAVDLVAFGCTDVSQATRYATWILQSELNNIVVISYSGGIDHYDLTPGNIVEFHDSNERINRRGGRIVSQSGVNVVLDATSAASAGNPFALTLSDGTVHATTVASVSGVNLVMSAAPPVSALPWATYTVASTANGRQLYKVIKVNETSNSIFSVTLQRYSLTKTY